MSGVDIPTTQELMGHADFSMTLRYSHLSPDHKGEAMDVMKSHFSAKSTVNFHNFPLGAVGGQTRRSRLFTELESLLGIDRERCCCLPETTEEKI